MRKYERMSCLRLGLDALPDVRQKLLLTRGEVELAVSAALEMLLAVVSSAMWMYIQE